MIIYSNQIKRLQEFLKDRFVVSTHLKIEGSVLEEIRLITDEALNFKIQSEMQVERYIRLFLENRSAFTNKPEWMLNVLQNELYEVDDKLDHIEKNINLFS